MDPLQRGSTGPAVTLLQILLNELGADLQADGVFGPRTEAALRAVQQRYVEIGPEQGFTDGHVLRELTQEMGTLSDTWAICLSSLFGLSDRGQLIADVTPGC